MSRFLPFPASAQAGELDTIMTLVHALIALLFVGWTVFLIWMLVRFRRSRQGEPQARQPDARVPAALEVGVVAAEVVLLGVFAIPAWIAFASGPPEGSSPLIVRVVAEQFAWNAHYAGDDGRFGDTRIALVAPANPLGLDRTAAGADDIVMTNRLLAIKDRPLMIQLSSKDVIHSFGVPNMRVKMDANPGMVTPVWFTPTVAGQFDVVCSQLCGIGHYRMRAILDVVDAGVFTRLMAAERAGS